MAMRLRYPQLAPDGYTALSSLGHYIKTGTALEPVLLSLVYLRASELNSCDFCIGMHTAELHKHNEPQSRIDAVADWRSSDAFTARWPGPRPSPNCTVRMSRTLTMPQ